LKRASAERIARKSAMRDSERGEATQRALRA